MRMVIQQHTEKAPKAPPRVDEIRDGGLTIAERRQRLEQEMIKTRVAPSPRNDSTLLTFYKEHSHHVSSTRSEKSLTNEQGNMAKETENVVPEESLPINDEETSKNAKKTLKATVVELKEKIGVDVRKVNKESSCPTSPIASAKDDNALQASSEINEATMSRIMDARLQRLQRLKAKYVSGNTSDQDDRASTTPSKVSSRSSSPACSYSTNGGDKNSEARSPENQVESYDSARQGGEDHTPVESRGRSRANSATFRKLRDASPAPSIETIGNNIDTKLNLLKQRRKLQHSKHQQETSPKLVSSSMKEETNNIKSDNKLSVATEFETDTSSLTSFGVGSPVCINSPDKIDNDFSPVLTTSKPSKEIVKNTMDSDARSTEQGNDISSFTSVSTTMKSSKEIFTNTMDSDVRSPERGNDNGTGEIAPSPSNESVMTSCSSIDSTNDDIKEKNAIMENMQNKPKQRSPRTPSPRTPQSNNFAPHSDDFAMPSSPQVGERIDILKGFGLTKDSVANVGKFASLDKRNTRNSDTKREDSSMFNDHFDSVAGGLTAVAAVSALFLGPAAMIVGAASVGVGVGILQMPEEQRASYREKAAKAIKHAESASEQLSNSCAVACENSGVSKKYPHVTNYCSHMDNTTEMNGGSPRGVGTWDTKNDNFDFATSNRDSHDASSVMDKTFGDVMDGPKLARVPSSSNRGQSPGFPQKQAGNRQIACMRKVPFIPVNEIHALEPSRQPIAWLDVMASANTTRDEKNEAMEEIMMFAKDKNRAQMLLEEGMLESLVWIFNEFVKSSLDEPEHTSDTDRLAGLGDDGSVVDLPSNVQCSEAFFHAKLAATCCITLGKAYCAVVHTNGDLLLMSSYDRGNVPEERQLAQMLYEVPHHMTVTKSSIPDGKEVLSITEISMLQAEALAKAIKALTEGKQYVTSSYAGSIAEE